MSLTKRVEEFFEISANINFGSVFPYLGSATFSFYNILDGSNSNDWLLNGAATASLIIGFCISGISYSIYKSIESRPEELEEIEGATNNRLIKNVINYYKRTNKK
ncbi:MAG: hypothetical protein ACPLXC_00280 [Candidatus Pacearchaeota archaeon]